LIKEGSGTLLLVTSIPDRNKYRRSKRYLSNPQVRKKLIEEGSGTLLSAASIPDGNKYRRSKRYLSASQAGRKHKRIPS